MGQRRSILATESSSRVSASSRRAETGSKPRPDTAMRSPSTAALSGGASNSRETGSAASATGLACRFRWSMWATVSRSQVPENPVGRPSVAIAARVLAPAEVLALHAMATSHPAGVVPFRRNVRSRSWRRTSAGPPRGLGTVCRPESFMPTWPTVSLLAGSTRSGWGEYVGDVEHRAGQLTCGDRLRHHTGGRALRSVTCGDTTGGQAGYRLLRKAHDQHWSRSDTRSWCTGCGPGRGCAVREIDEQPVV